METLAQQRAADAVNTLASLLGALIDQPRILTECSGHADLSGLAELAARSAVNARELADNLEAAALAMAGAVALRRAA